MVEKKEVHTPNKEDSCLIFDIECDSVDTKKAELKWVGFYSYTEKKYYYVRNTTDGLSEIRRLFNDHTTLIGYNIKNYDLPVLKRYDIDFRGKNLVDLYEVLAQRTKGGKGRHAILGTGGVVFSDMKLGTVVKTLGITSLSKIENFDYELFKKQRLSNEEKDLIVNYMKHDIKITRKLFDYLYDYFFNMRSFLSDEQNRKFYWFNTSTGSYAYKVLCNRLGLEETYDDSVEKKAEDYEGGFVLEPTVEEHKGKIIVYDFASQHPHSMMQANLFTPVERCPKGKCSNPYKGDGKIFRLKGVYCGCTHGSKEQEVKKLFLERKELKRKKDSRQYAIKIVINSLYGISALPNFSNIYTPFTASDTTAMSRQQSEFMKAYVEKEGYQVVYQDTDSLFIIVDDKSEEVLDKLVKQGIEDIKKALPFPQDTYTMEKDKVLKALWFFKDEEGGFLKKNYVYVTDKNELVIKGLPIMKSNVSRVAKHVFEKYLKNQILSDLNCKFDRDYLKQLIYDELGSDLSIAAQLYRVDSTESYKTVNKRGDKISCLNGEISRVYGVGSHYLVPNNRFGVGKGKRYCTIEEFRKEGLSIGDVDLSKCWSDLKPFIRSEQKMLGDY